MFQCIDILRSITVIELHHMGMSDVFPVLWAVGQILIWVGGGMTVVVHNCDTWLARPLTYHDTQVIKSTQ
jgi:hypothetical protein